MKKYVRVDIVDNQYDYGEEKIMDTVILINPSIEKLEELQEKLNNRFDENNEFTDNYGAVYEYIDNNFEVLKMSEPIYEIEW